MLATTKEMLLDAQAGHYAVGAFNVENLEFVMAVIRAAEDRRSPVIMQTTPGTVKYANLDYFAALCRVAAEEASVPVAIHLDHGDGFGRCVQAMHAGYTSVMIDGSHVPFEENVALTASVTKVAGPVGIPVEAELGKVGGKEDDGPAVEGESPTPIPTRPRSSSRARAAARSPSALARCTASTRAPRTSSRASSRPSASAWTSPWCCTVPRASPMTR